MGTVTEIAWCHHTFNPWEGCQKVAPECAHCYAEARDKHWHRGENWGPLRVLNGSTIDVENRGPLWRGTRLVRTSESYWRQPLKWAKEARAAGERRRVFCLSLGDILEDRAELIEPRDQTFELIYQTRDVLDWLLLTKRPENAGLIPDGIWRLVWAGVSAGTQETADRNVPLLLKIPAKVRFVSAEPLLGPVDVYGWLIRRNPDPPATNWDMSRRQSVEWVIVGGESGHGARPMHPDWARLIRDQCAAAGVPFFFKQHGEWLPLSDYDFTIHGADTSKHQHRFAWRIGEKNNNELPISCYRVGKKAAGRLLDGREWSEMPEVRR